MPAISWLADAVALAQAGDENAELVGGALADGREPPAVNQFVVSKDADHDVGVTDVDC